MTLDEKIRIFKVADRSEQKGTKKWELLDEHTATWRVNGRNSLTHTVLTGRRWQDATSTGDTVGCYGAGTYSPKCEVITV